MYYVAKNSTALATGDVVLTEHLEDGILLKLQNTDNNYITNILNNGIQQIRTDKTKRFIKYEEIEKIAYKTYLHNGYVYHSFDVYEFDEKENLAIYGDHTILERVADELSRKVKISFGDGKIIETDKFAEKNKDCFKTITFENTKGNITVCTDVVDRHFYMEFIFDNDGIKHANFFIKYEDIIGLTIDSTGMTILGNDYTKQRKYQKIEIPIPCDEKGIEIIKDIINLKLSSNNDESAIKATDKLEKKGKKFNRKWLAMQIAILVVIFGGIIGLICMCSGPKDNSNHYEDVWNKHPNEWSEDEEEHVNDFFNWMDEQNED